MKIKNIHLILIQIALIITFVLSFTKSCSNQKRTSIKTALINPKNKELITSFELTQNGQKLFFTKDFKDSKDSNRKSIWLMQNETIGSSETLTTQQAKKMIANGNQIEKLLSELTKIRDMYKISDRLSKNNSFGLTTNDTFCIKYYTQDTSNEIFIGSLDFSQDFRYLMTGKNLTVYQIDNSIENYLTLNSQFWTDQNIISKALLPDICADDIQRILITENNQTKTFTNSNENWISYVQTLLELRHGGISENQNGELISKIKIELGNKSQLYITAFKTDKEEVINLSVEYELLNLKNYKTNLKISNWTYSKLKQIMQK